MAGRRLSDRAGRGKLRSPGRPGVARREDRRRFWAFIAAGLSSEDAAMAVGVSQPVGFRWAEPTPSNRSRRMVSHRHRQLGLLVAGLGSVGRGFLGGHGGRTRTRWRETPAN